MLKKAFFAFFLFFVACIGHAQQYLLLNGKVMDKKTRQPVPYAHIGIPEKGIGTTSGFDGKFELKVPVEYQNTTMTVSCMGYETASQSVQRFKEGSTIQLDMALNQLAEVVEHLKRPEARGLAVRRNQRKIGDRHRCNVLGASRELGSHNATYMNVS